MSETLLTQEEVQLVRRLQNEWDPECEPPVSIHMVKVNPLSDAAKEALRRLAVQYGMNISITPMGDKDSIAVMRPRR